MRELTEEEKKRGRKWCRRIKKMLKDIEDGKEGIEWKTQVEVAKD